MIYQDNFKLIGNTPVIKLNRLMRKYNLESEIYLKLEMFNLAGSIKDRASFQMIRDGFERGVLNDESTIIEPTSGNTGIALAALCAGVGLKLIVFMPASASIERQKLMKLYGVDLRIVDSPRGMEACVEMAKELQKVTENSFVLSQFENEANKDAHYLTTAKEIHQDFNDELDYMVFGIGTGGTISGVAKYYKENDLKAKFIGVEPTNSPIITKNEKGLHKIDGIGAGFIPKILDLDLIDEVLTVNDEDALMMQKELATKEGLSVGISSAANVYMMIQIAKSKKGVKILTTAADSADRYLSKIVFED